MLKIAILYICTGKYDVFWSDFYRSSQTYFLREHSKTYFVFTDSNNIYDSDKPWVKIGYQENLGWPGNTLFRYNMFKKIEEELKKYDYIFFLNANMLFVDYVGEEVLPTKEGLVVTQHPGFYNKERSQFTYDNNPGSLAYIPNDLGTVYVCGGFNGGKAKEFIELVNTINENTHTDYNNGIIAIWHDESHLNKYIVDKKYKLLSPSYAYPEGWKLPFKEKIKIRDKTNYGGFDFLRKNSNPKVTVLMPVYNGEKYLKRAINSIINQTYTDFEFIIINDGSTDKSEQIIKAYKDPRIRYFRNERNMKLVPTLNKGLALAQGEYIVRMDCDDISHKDRISRQVSFMDENPEVGVCGSWIKTIGGKRSKINKYYTDDALLQVSYLFWGSIAHPSVIMRKELFKEFKLEYDECFIHAEDFDLWSRCIGKFKLANMPDVLLYYRLSKNNIGNKYNNEQVNSTRKAIHRNLETFGIPFSREEFEDHIAISFSQRISEEQFSERAFSWLAKLIEYNNKNRVFNLEAFKKVIEDYKFRLIFANPQYVYLKKRPVTLNIKQYILLLMKIIYLKLKNR